MIKEQKCAHCGALAPAVLSRKGTPLEHPGWWSNRAGKIVCSPYCAGFIGGLPDEINQRLRAESACGVSHERRVCPCYAPACRNFLCATCGVAAPWHKRLMIVNPTIAGRFCADCVDVEAAYHGLSIEEMHACRARLRVKRIAQASPGSCSGHREVLQDPIGRTDMAVAMPVLPARLTDLAILRPYISGTGRIEHERVEARIPAPARPYLERGEACWCHLAKDCVGSHEFHGISIVSQWP